MVKRADEPKVSPFDALRIARLSKTAPNVRTSDWRDAQPAEQTTSQTVIPLAGLAKSRDPRYVKFTTYIPRETHLRAKTRLVSQGRELSDLVTELLGEWLSKQPAG